MLVVSAVDCPGAGEVEGAVKVEDEGIDVAVVADVALLLVQNRQR